MYRELDLGLTPEQAKIKESIHEFAAKVMRPAATALDRLDPSDVIARDSALWRVLRQAYELGYHTAGLPEHVGGLGFGGLELHILYEEMGWGASDLAIAIGVCGFPFSTLANSGNPDMIRRFVEPFVADREARMVGCWAITEPDHGSDRLIVGLPEFRDPKIPGQLVARREGDELVLNGQKSAWVSNGTIATHALAFLTTDPSLGMAGGGVALVPLDLPGVSKGKPLDKLGQRALNQGEIFFEDVHLPREYMLTEAPMYEFALNMTLTLANAAMSAIFTGVARAAYEEALAYTQQRVQGGRLICEHQLVQKRLFDMFARVEACRALSRRVMVHNHSVMPGAIEYSIAAKTFCTDAAFEVASSALQLFGGNGLSREYPIEKIMRDARASQIEDGSNDVLSLVGMQRILAQVRDAG